MNPFKPEPNSWHHKNMVPALELLMVAGNICLRKGISIQLKYLKVSFPFAPSTFFFLRFREEKNTVTAKKKMSVFIPKPTVY